MSDPDTQTPGVSPEDERGIREAIGYYVEGLRTGDPAILRKGFHAQAVLAGSLGDSIPPVVTGLPGLIDMVAAFAAPADSGEPYHAEIASIDVTGHIATVHIFEQEYNGYSFKDHFHLLKVDGRWWITSKLYQAV